MPVIRAVLAALMVVPLFFLPCGRAVCAETEGSRPTGPEYVHADAAGGQADDTRGLLPDTPFFGGSREAPLLKKDGAKEAGPVPACWKIDLTEEERGIVDTIRKSLAASSTSNGFDIPFVLNDAVDLYIRYFTGTGRKVFARWLERAQRYVPTIKAILKKNGLPEDLAYVAMIESGFNMKARSAAKARGPWQFIHETGERYGLKVDFWVDERCDLEKSTVAAARYLKVLFDRFGCWYLAAAGYNAGEHRVERAIEKHDTRDFWKLREYKTLPRETQEYVPQLIAAALIAKDPEKYGFGGTGTVPVYRLVKVEVPGGMALGRIAGALSMDLAELRTLNPELMRGITPPGRMEYEITLPGMADDDDARKALDAELKNGGQVVGVITHHVKKRETLPGILKRYQVTRADLALLNEGGERLRCGRRPVLYIPRFAPKDQEPGSEAAAAGVLSGDDDDGDVVSLDRPGKRRIFATGRPRLVKHVVHRAARRDHHRPRKADWRASLVKKHAAGRV
ncbi:MAG: transglycosylase SLT domain-containing protein [Syntrophorhabdales bacterium]|jgi:membrane-bound lytic murein transglycosylase D